MTGTRPLLEVRDLRRTHHLAMLFISHDLRVVPQIADRVAVMRRGAALDLDDAGSVTA